MAKLLFFILGVVLIVASLGLLNNHFGFFEIPSSYSSSTNQGEISHESQKVLIEANDSLNESESVKPEVVNEEVLQSVVDDYFAEINEIELEDIQVVDPIQFEKHVWGREGW